MKYIHIVTSILEIRHLRTLRAIDETGSLAAAARLVSLTQSALSHQLKQLEEYYQLPLFTRNTRPMKFTVHGQRLLALANEILPKIDNAESGLSENPHTAERFHVAIECHSCFDWLLPALNHVRKRWPALDVDARMVFDALPMLHAGSLDVVITSDPVQDERISFMELFRYEAQLLLPPGHRLARRKVISARDLLEETLITYPVDIERLDVYKAFLQPAGHELKHRRTSELTDIIIQHVDGGRGITVLPDWVLQQNQLARELVIRSLGRSGVYRTVYAAVREEDANNHELADFIDITPTVVHNLKNRNRNAA